MSLCFYFSQHTRQVGRRHNCINANNSQEYTFVQHLKTTAINSYELSTIIKEPSPISIKHDKKPHKMWMLTTT